MGSNTVAQVTRPLKSVFIVIELNDEAIPFFFLVYRRMRVLILGRSVGLEKINLKKNHKNSPNSRPWYPRTTFKVNNIHIFGLIKCTIYCEKCSCFRSCFSLCCYYAHFSD